MNGVEVTVIGIVIFLVTTIVISTIVNNNTNRNWERKCVAHGAASYGVDGTSTEFTWNDERANTN